MGRLVDIEVRVPSNSIEQVEDLHLLIEHMITKSLREVRSDQEARSLSRSSGIQKVSQIDKFPSPEDEQKDSHFAPAELVRDQGSLGIIYSISRILSAQGAPERQLEDVLQFTLEKFGATSGSLYVLDNAGRHIVGLVAYNGNLEKLPAEEKERLVRAFACVPGCSRQMERSQSSHRKKLPHNPMLPKPVRSKSANRVISSYVSSNVASNDRNI